MNKLDRSNEPSRICRTIKETTNVKEKKNVPVTEQNPKHTVQDDDISVLPYAFDILCGKTKECFHHEGSRYFRSVICNYKESYRSCRTKQEKMKITKRIFETLTNSSSPRRCRFLKYDTTTHHWEEIGEISARDKISHALRFAASQRQQGRNNIEEQRRNKKANDCVPSGSPSVPACAQKKKLVPCVLPEPIPSSSDRKITEEASSKMETVPTSKRCQGTAVRCLAPSPAPSCSRSADPGHTATTIRFQSPPKEPLEKVASRTVESKKGDFNELHSVAKYRDNSNLWERLVKRQRQLLTMITKNADRHTSIGTGGTLLYGSQNYCAPVFQPHYALDINFSNKDLIIMNEPLVDF